MTAIPTILKGDDSGAIALTIAAGRTYAGATLVVAYQGVTRRFTNLTPGQTINLSFTHDETANFALKTAPVLMRLVGPYGGEETVENAEARIKVTDCLAEVNAGGSFVIRPGGGITDPTKVPITDVGDMPARYTLAELAAKVDQIVHVLAQRSLLALAIIGSFCACGAVQTATARLDSLYNDSMVVTNVTESGGVDTNAVKTLINSEIGGTNTVKSAVETVMENAEAWSAKQDAIADYTSTNAVREIAAPMIQSATNALYAAATNYTDAVVGAAATAGTNYTATVTADMETQTHAAETYQPIGDYVESSDSLGGSLPWWVWDADKQKNVLGVAMHGDSPITSFDNFVFKNEANTWYGEQFYFDGIFSYYADPETAELSSVEVPNYAIVQREIRKGTNALDTTLRAEIAAHAPANYAAVSNAAMWASNEVSQIHIDAEDPTFSNAVLAVGLNIDTNSVAVLNEIAATFGDFPIGGTATTVGGLLAALAAAVAWLKRNKADKSELPYHANVTATLKDRAFNALTFDGTEYNLSTALAAVTPTAANQPRDLLIVATATATTTISFAAGTIKGDKPTIDGAGTWIITLTEYASGVWYCRQIKMEDAA